MLTAIEGWRAGIAEAVRDIFQVEIEAASIPVTFPPKSELGDIATPVAFSLAKKLKKNPAVIAGALASVKLDGIEKIEVSGGYMNLFAERSWLISRFLEGGFVPEAGEEKVIVEHTNINPNKAAHVGHLRNAVLGDTLVRCLRYLNRETEVQNYIDDTGVQVADVVVGFQKILVWTPKKVRLATGGVEGEPFDRFCWDLYAKVGPWYEENDPEKSERRKTLALMEESDNETSETASIVAEAIVRAHLNTMERLSIRYDLLPHESHILKSGFWRDCFEKLKSSGAIHKVPSDSEDKNRGCWVMGLGDSEQFKGMSDADKVIVRSNGTVTYIGKDIAYQLWKFGLLGKDFHYRRFRTPDYELWRTDSAASDDGAPSFGGGTRVYNVIDVRQSYLQKVVAEGLRQMDYKGEAEKSVHFAYEMVALSTNFIRSEIDKGVCFPGLEEKDLEKSYVEMSGRKGLGFQADLLIDRLEERAVKEIMERDGDLGGMEVRIRAHSLALGALRYYMIKYGRTQVVAFDLDQALAFEGDTGPYIQYACVRAEQILQKAVERRVPLPNIEDEDTLKRVSQNFDEDSWALLSLISRTPVIVNSAVSTLDLNMVAKHLHDMAQAFHAYYHGCPVLSEAVEEKREARLFTVSLFARMLRRFLDELLGIPVPSRM